MSEYADLSGLGINVKDVIRNASPARLYEDAVRLGDGHIASNGALAVSSTPKTGCSPKDKRVVEHPDSVDDIWWGNVNIKLSENSFQYNRQRAIDYLNTRQVLYVVDGYAGWDPKYRIKVRIVCARPYHALFMHNMLIRPTEDELAQFGKPDYVVINGGQFPATFRM